MSSCVPEFQVMNLKKSLRYALKDFLWLGHGGDSEFDETLKTAWTSALDSGFLRYKLETNPDLKDVNNGSMRVMILVLMSRFSKRRDSMPFKAMDEPCPVGEFNFTKVKPEEILFDLSFSNISDCKGKIIANVSPFMLGHSLIVPDPEKLMNQVLRKSPLKLAIQAMLISGNENLCMGFNSLLACASVNHLHFHLWYNKVRLFSAIRPIKRKSSLTQFMELEHHPVDNFAFEFSNQEDFEVNFERLWKVVEACQDLQIAHNLFAARSGADETSSGHPLRVVLWPRRSVFEAKAFQRLLQDPPPCGTASLSTAFDVAVAELAGMLVVPDDATASTLAKPACLTEVYCKQRLEPERMKQLESVIVSMGL